MKKFLFLVLFLFVSCSPAGYQSGIQDVDNTYMFKYTVVDGMPCLLYSGDGVSCDWSQWNGRVVDGEIVIGD